MGTGTGTGTPLPPRRAVDHHAVPARFEARVAPAEHAARRDQDQDHVHVHVQVHARARDHAAYRPHDSVSYVSARVSVNLIVIVIVIGRALSHCRMAPIRRPTRSPVLAPPASATPGLPAPPPAPAPQASGSPASARCASRPGE